jgi:hypothetical protein
MEGDVIVMQDIFVFEQTAVVEERLRAACDPPGFARSSSRSSR